MRTFSAPFLAAALALFPMAALAQDGTTEFPTSVDLADAQNGVTERHGEWEIRCAEGGANCRLFQAAFDAEGNEVANISLQKLPEGSSALLGVVVVTPLLTLLPRGLTMGVDDGIPASYPYSWCDRVGCYARFGLTAGQVDAMKSGTLASLSLFAITDAENAINATLSLSGFTAGFNALAEK